MINIILGDIIPKDHDLLVLMHSYIPHIAFSENLINIFEEEQPIVHNHLDKNYEWFESMFIIKLISFTNLIRSDLRELNILYR